MLCTNCRAEIPDTSRFCHYCGAAVRRPETTSISVADDASIATLRAAVVQSLDKLETVEAGPVERYQILEKLGSGKTGQGTVYSAHDRWLNRHVAIKRIRQDRAASPKARQRFLVEAKAMACLDHYNIVKLHEVDEDTEGVYIVMEYVDGKDLGVVIRESGKLDPERAIAMTRQICNALTLAHDKGIVHRDIKPANIMISSVGVPKLTDFGLAQQSDEHHLTTTGTLLGTPIYASPEQRRDSKHVDRRTDIYSLGATLYEMLTGRLPDVIRPDLIPEELRSIVLHALEEQPERRYGSMAEFSRELEETTIGDAISLLPEADSLFNSGDLESALLLYRRVLRQSPLHMLARQQAALIEAKIETIRKARSEGNEAMNAANWELAARAWKRVLQSAPGDAEAKRQLSRAQEENRNLRLGPTVQAARRALDAKEYGQARQQASSALEMDPENKEAKSILQTARQKLSGLTKEKLLAATEAYKNKEYDQALVDFNSALELLPEDHDQRARVVEMRDLAISQQAIARADKAIAAGHWRQASMHLDEAERYAEHHPRVADRIKSRRQHLKDRYVSGTKQIDSDSERFSTRSRAKKILLIGSNVTILILVIFFLGRASRRSEPDQKVLEPLATIDPEMELGPEPVSPLAPTATSLPQEVLEKPRILLANNQQPASQPINTLDSSPIGTDNRSSLPSPVSAVATIELPLPVVGAPFFIPSPSPDFRVTNRTKKRPNRPGEAITWTGSVKFTRDRLGEAHLWLEHAIGPPDDERMFEAFTTDPTFLEKLERCNKDRVRITGTLATGLIAFRMNAGLALVRIQKLESLADGCVIQPDEHAASKAPQDSAINWIAGDPAKGDLKFSAFFDQYDEKQQLVELILQTAPGQMRPFKVHFPNAAPEFFQDYSKGDPVNVELQKTSGIDTGFLGSSIVRERNKLSLVTSDGRGIPAENFDKDLSMWKTTRAGRQLGRRFRIVGIYEASAESGQNCTISLSNMFGDSSQPSQLDVVCGLSQQSLAFLRQLRKGEEVVLEVVAQATPEHQTQIPKPLLYVAWSIRRLEEPQIIMRFIAPVAAQPPVKN